MGVRAGALAFLLTLMPLFRAVSEEIEIVLREGTNFAAARSAADGSFVLDLQGTLWRVGADGGDASALTDGLGDDRMPHVSRDGSRIVFQSYRTGTWDIWAVDPDGSNLVALSESPFDDREPMFSPDGSRIAFSSDRNGNYDVWILELDSKDLRAVTNEPANEYMPAWSPEGDAIAFVSERGEDRFALYRVGLDPEDAPTELAVFEGDIASPAFSPDGSRIALRWLQMGTTSVDAVGRAPVASRLVLVPAEGGDVETVETPEDVFPFRAEWMGDAELVYTAAGSLWRHQLDADDGPMAIPFAAKITLDRPSYRRREVVLSPENEPTPVRGILRPVVSPDGSYIAYAALGDIWIVSSDGGAPVMLTRDEDLDSDPEWSPDSTSVIYSSDRGGTMDLWIKPVTEPSRVAGRQLTSGTGAELAPAFSPDGSKIAYVDEQSRLHVMTADGSDDRVLTPARRGVSQPSWSSDSVHLAMAVHQPMTTRFREGYNLIEIIDTVTGDARVLEQPDRSIGTRDGDGPVWRRDGGALAFAMDGGLWVMPVAPDGTPRGTPRQVAGEAVDFPSWWPDGHSILFVSPNGLKRVDLETGRASYVALEHHYEPTTAGGRMMIRDVRIVDGTSSTPREHQDVIIAGNRIESIAPTADVPVIDMPVVPGTGKTLIPGLVEMHAHFSLPSWGSQHGKVWLAYGITSMRTPADAPYRVLEERESIRAGRRIGPRVFFTGGTMDGGRIYYTGAHALDDVEELAQEMQRAFDLRYDLIKTYVRLPDDLQKLVIEEAHRLGIFVTSHELYPAIAHGIDGIEHVAGTSRRGYSPKLSDLRRSYGDVVEIIGRSGVYFTPTVLIYGGWSLARAREPEILDDRRFTTLFPAWARERFLTAPVPDDVEGSRRAMAPIFATVDAVGALGGNIVAGTDSPIIPYGLSLILEIEQLSEAGLGPIEALRSATQVAAEALGVGDDLGTVEAGKVADLVLLGGDPSEDIKNLRKTEVVIVNGRLLTVEQLLRSH